MYRPTRPEPVDWLTYNSSVEPSKTECNAQLIHDSYMIVSANTVLGGLKRSRSVSQSQVQAQGPPGVRLDPFVSVTLGEYK